MDDKKLLEMSEEEFREALAELNIANREQADYAKKTWILTMISTISIVIVALFIIIYCTFLIPKINKLLNQAQVSVDNIADLSQKLTDSNLDGIIEDVGGLVTTTEKDLELTMKKIDELNIEELNRGISNLSDVIEPLAEFFGVLGGKAEDLSKLDVEKQVESSIVGIESDIEGTIDDIGGGIQDSVESIGASIGSGIEKGIGSGIESIFGKPEENNNKTKSNKKK